MCKGSLPFEGLIVNVEMTVSVGYDVMTDLLMAQWQLSNNYLFLCDVILHSVRQYLARVPTIGYRKCLFGILC